MKRNWIALFASILFTATAYPASNAVTVHVIGMVCQFCSQGITKKFKANEAVEKVQVDMEKKEVHISMKDGKSLSDTQITEIIRDSGVNVERIERQE